MLDHEHPVRDDDAVTQLFDTEDVEVFSEALNYLLHEADNRALRGQARNALHQALQEHLSANPDEIPAASDIFRSIKDRIRALLKPIVSQVC